MAHSIYNTNKGRIATLNEVAKYLIIDRLDSLCAIQESWGMENLTEKEATEVARFYEIYFKSIKKKLNPSNIYRLK